MRHRSTLLRELKRLKEVFPDLKVSQDLCLVLIPKFGPLPRQYNKRYTRLLIQLPNSQVWEYEEPKAYVDSDLKIWSGTRSMHMPETLTPPEFLRAGFVYCCMRVENWSWARMGLLDFIALLVEWLEGLRE